MIMMIIIIIIIIIICNWITSLSAYHIISVISNSISWHYSKISKNAVQHYWNIFKTPLKNIFDCRQDDLKELSSFCLQMVHLSFENHIHVVQEAEMYNHKDGESQ